MNDNLLVIRKGAMLANESVMSNFPKIFIIIFFTFSIKIPSKLYVTCCNRTKNDWANDEFEGDRLSKVDSEKYRV